MISAVAPNLLDYDEAFWVGLIARLIEYFQPNSVCNDVRKVLQRARGT